MNAPELEHSDIRMLARLHDVHLHVAFVDKDLGKSIRQGSRAFDRESVLRSPRYSLDTQSFEVAIKEKCDFARCEHRQEGIFRPSSGFRHF